MKHTPGPWIFTRHENTEDVGRIVNSDQITICDFGDSTHYYPTEGEPPEEENLRLILAAPEMYEVLTKCMSLFALGGLALHYAKKKPEIYEGKRAKAREIEREIMNIINKVEGKDTDA